MTDTFNVKNVQKSDVEDQQVTESAEQIAQTKKEIKYDTRDYVIEYLVKKFEEDLFYVPLEYQRKFIWDDKNKCNFIESILMGLPIPFMFFSDTEDGRIEIVDGAQRVQTLVQFCENGLTLTGLNVLTKSNGLTFEQLSKPIQRRFLNTSIRVVYLEEGTTEQTRQEIFKRINTGGTPLNSAEARRGSFDGPFKDFVEQCTKNELFNRLAPRPKSTEDRYEGFELVARFFAYSDNYETDFTDYDGRVANYIDNYVKGMNESFEHHPELRTVYQKRFESMLTYAEKILGERGFRKSLTAKSTPRARFEALSIGISLALTERPDIPTDISVDWLDSEEFLKITKSDAANNKSNLRRRICFVKDKLLV